MNDTKRFKKAKINVKFRLPILMLFYIIITDSISRYDEVLGIDTFYLFLLLVIFAPLHAYFTLRGGKE